MINFKTNVEHPHKPLLHHLKSIKEWISPEVSDRYPIAKSSWSILQDFHHNPSVLISDPALISLACIQLSLHSLNHYLFEALSLSIRIVCTSQPTAVSNFEQVLFPGK